MRGDGSPPPSHPPSPAGISFRGQVDALGAHRTVERAPGGHLNATQKIVITKPYFTVLLISLPDEYKQKIVCHALCALPRSIYLIHFERIVDSRFFYFPNSDSLLQPWKSGFCL